MASVDSLARKSLETLHVFDVAVQKQLLNHLRKIRLDLTDVDQHAAAVGLNKGARDDLFKGTMTMIEGFEGVVRAWHDNKYSHSSFIKLFVQKHTDLRASYLRYRQCLHEKELAKAETFLEDCEESIAEIAKTLGIVIAQEKGLLEEAA